MWKGKKIFKKVIPTETIDPNREMSIPEETAGIEFKLGEAIKTKLQDSIKGVVERIREEKIEAIRKIIEGE